MRAEETLAGTYRSLHDSVTVAVQRAMDDWRSEIDPASEDGTTMAQDVATEVLMCFIVTEFGGPTMVLGSMYDATKRAYEMAIEALTVVAMDEIAEEATPTQLALMARIVARSARSIHEEGQP